MTHQKTSKKTILTGTKNVCGNKDRKGERKSRKEGGRGKNKEKWTREERLVLWECYVRSGKRETLGYIERVMNMWNGRDISVRSQASIISQIKCIEKGGLLSEFDKNEVETRVFTQQCVSESDDTDIEFTVDDSTAITMEEPVLPNGEILDARVLVERLSSFGQDEEGKVVKKDEGVEARVLVERQDCFSEGDKVRPMTKDEVVVLNRLSEVFASDDLVEIPNLKGRDRYEVLKEVNTVNGVIHNLKFDANVTNVNKLLYASAFVVCERLGLMKKKGKSLTSKKPWWQRRLEKSILQWRQDLGRLSEMERGVELKEKTRKEMQNRYKVSERGTRSVRVFIENKIKSATTKIRFYVESNAKLRQNTLFNNNQSFLYKELGGSNNKPNAAPNPKESQDFWEGIWATEGAFNDQASWLNYVEGTFSNVHEQEDISITPGNVLKGIRRMNNWKAPGPDGVRGFWFKKFSSLHSHIVEALGRCLEEGNVPEWMVKGRTVLIQKDATKGTSPGNYRPITCLPLMWKLLSGIFAEEMYDHLDNNHVLPDEQKGCRKRSRGTKDQLLIDKAILKEAKKKKRCLSMAWIDYQKAFDMVPHAWILKMLKLTKVAGNISSMLERTMAMWKTELTFNGDRLASVDINRGIFQGDSLSPLLFVLAMIPLTRLLNREKFGFHYGDFDTSINHLFFMDDLKLYAKNEDDLGKLMGIVHQFSNDIGMTFGMNKCASIVIRAGVKVKSEGITLPNKEKIKDLDEEGYKYLGVLQTSDILHSEMKELIRGEYTRRVKAVAKSKLYSKNLFTALNSWAVSIVRYSAGILDWTVQELKSLDIKTRKILTMNGIFHKKGNVDRLYLKRREGGRGLISIEDCVRSEEGNLKEYIRHSFEPYLQASGDVLLHDQDDEGSDEREIENGKAYKERVYGERVDRILSKQMHGKFFHDISEVASPRSNQWVMKGNINKSTEGLIFAAQEQALRTNWLKARITGESKDSSCRKCKKEVETVAHLVSGCGELAQREYKKRHDRMGLRIYWEICKKYGVKCKEKWYEETPEEVRKSDCGRYEVWWDRHVETTKALDHNRPDVVVIDKEKQEWTIIDFSVPNDRNILKKEKEKVEHYSPLAYEIRKMYKVNTKIIPIVVGALGVVTNNLAPNLQLLGIKNVSNSLQVSAIIGTSIILRKVLSLKQ